MAGRRSDVDRDTIAATQKAWSEARPTFGRFYEPMSAEVLEGLMDWISKRLPPLVRALIDAEHAMTACGWLDRNVLTDLQFAQDDLDGTWRDVFWQLSRIVRRIADVERGFFATPEDVEQEVALMERSLPDGETFTSPELSD